MTSEIQHTPDPSHQQLLTLFEALRQLPALTPLQLTAHEVALERCRLALEWQTAISEAAVLLFERADTMLANIHTASQSVLRHTSANAPGTRASDWGAIAREAELLLQTTGEYHRVNAKLRTCLLQLGTQIEDLEGLSCQLAALSENVAQSQQRMANQLR